MYRVVWLNKTRKEGKVSKYALKNKTIDLPNTDIIVLSDMEEHRESVNDYGIFIHLQNDVLNSAANT
jgi:hypothetical protein